MMSSMFVLICNRFTLNEPIAVKYKLLRGYPSFTISFEKTPDPEA